MCHFAQVAKVRLPNLSPVRRDQWEAAPLLRGAQLGYIFRRIRRGDLHVVAAGEVHA